MVGTTKLLFYKFIREGRTARQSHTQGNAMIYLTEISIPVKCAVDATLNVDPLVAADLDYAIKTWMAGKPGLACRPWRGIILRNTLRITGWRASPADGPAGKSTYLGTREIALQAGESLALSGRFLALRRIRKSRCFDAANDSDDHERAYSTWLRERLIDVSPFAAVERFQIDSFSQKRVLRKTCHSRAHTRVSSQIIPVVEATVCITIRDPAGVEAWLLHGVGPQKGFGYGAFFPSLNPAWEDSNG
jgi:hypothetical protein